MRAVLVVLLVAAVTAAQPPKPGSLASRQRGVPEVMDADAARASLERALSWLVRTQRTDGSWASGVITGLLDSGYSVASFYDWKLGANALAMMALRRAPETAARRTALDRAIRWFTTTRLPKRGSDWDNDTMWAVLYGVVALVEIADDPRYQDDPWQRPVRDRCETLIQVLVRNQIPSGGWAYYDNPPYTRRPKWGTSFCTALILPTLKRAHARGWLKSRTVIKRAVAYVKRCRLPNGAYEYDLNPIPRAPAGEHINKIKGSLGRVQVCNWALRICGDPGTTNQRIVQGLEHLMTDHRFLDIARMRPVPHEAYYANAGYFYFFGHFYAAEVIELLPDSQQEAWHARLRPHVIKTQRKDGSFCDFLGQDYLVVADTAYAAMTLQSGL